MIRRFIEAFFRHPWLVAAPVTIIPITVALVVLSAPPMYEATVGIWTSRPTYLSVADDSSPYVTVAQNHAGRLGELVRSRSFLTDVISRTSLTSRALNTSGSDTLERYFADRLDIAPIGDHLLILRFRADTSAESVEILDGLVGAYRGRSAANRLSQEKLAMSFYDARLVEAQHRLDIAQAAEAAYLADHPGLRPSTGGAAFGASTDLQFDELQHTAREAQAAVDDASTSLRNAEIGAAAANAGQDLGFQVIDPTTGSPTPIRPIKKVVFLPTIGLVIGLILSLLLLTLLVIGDRAIRLRGEIAPRTDVIGVVPQLSAKGFGWHPGPAVIRRALGHAAGSAVAVRARTRLTW